MNNHSLKVLGLLTGVAMLGSLTAHAQDKATLDFLVKKGLITQSDEDSVAKSTAAVEVTPKDSAVKGLKLEGMIQAQYDFLTTEDKTGGAANPPSTDSFELRRVYLGAIADLGNGWGGEVLLDFAGTEGTQGPTAGSAGLGAGTIGQNSFEKIIITKKFDDLNALLTVGYRKVDFTQEEMTSSAGLKVIERSPVSRYFDENYDGVDTKRLGFANRHTGIFWNGNIADTGTLLDGAYYSVAMADGVNNQNIQISEGNNLGYNRFSYWATAGYQGTMADVKFDFGVHTGMSQSQNDSGTAAPAGQTNAMWGWNPYVKVDYSDFELSAEFLQAWVQRGRSTTATAGTGVDSEATPFGFNITPSYKINKEWEVAARYSHLSTNGRGTSISDVVRDGPSTTTGVNLYNDVDSYYVGVNWYIMGTSLKLSAGYEIDDFNNRQVGAAAANFTGPRAEVSGFRTQLQLQF